MADYIGPLISGVSTIIAALVGARASKSQPSEQSQQNRKPNIFLFIFLIIIILIQIFFFSVFSNKSIINKETDTVTSKQTDPPECYDNFNNDTIDGYFNEELWDRENIVKQYVQKDGMLIFSLAGTSKDSNLLVSKKYSDFKMNKGDEYTFEIKLKLDSVKHEGNILIMLDHWIKDDEKEERTAVCQLNKSGKAFCQYAKTKPDWKTLSGTEEIQHAFNTWHIFQIKVRDDMDFSFYLDDKRLKSYHPESSDIILNNFENVRFELKIGVTNWNLKTELPVVGYVDYVKVTKN